MLPAHIQAIVGGKFTALHETTTASPAKAIETEKPLVKSINIQSVIDESDELEYHTTEGNNQLDYSDM